MISRYPNDIPIKHPQWLDSQQFWANAAVQNPSVCAALEMDYSYLRELLIMSWCVCVILSWYDDTDDGDVVDDDDDDDDDDGDRLWLGAYTWIHCFQKVSKVSFFTW